MGCKRKSVTNNLKNETYWKKYAVIFTSSVTN